jgi:hypothetical protein
MDRRTQRAGKKLRKCGKTKRDWRLLIHRPLSKENDSRLSNLSEKKRKGKHF